MPSLWAVKGTDTLRITIHEDTNTVTMRLEGRIAGIAVSELRHAWGCLVPFLGPRDVLVDICGVTFVDGDGRETLQEIYRERQAGFVANTPLTKYFAQEAVRDGRKA